MTFECVLVGKALIKIGVADNKCGVSAYISVLIGLAQAKKLLDTWSDKQGSET